MLDLIFFDFWRSIFFFIRFDWLSIVMLIVYHAYGACKNGVKRKREKKGIKKVEDYVIK